LETFQINRKAMAELLLSLKGEIDIPPINILRQSWKLTHGNSLSGIIETDIPPILKKLFTRKQPVVGFSINEIVSLGNLIEYTNLSPTAVQNWVKRDIKELIGSPELGKKYSLEQAAILFIVEDLKSTLDFESIRKTLTLIFNNPSDRTDDVVNPIHFYWAYSSIVEQLFRSSNTEKDEEFLKEKAVKYAEQFIPNQSKEIEMITNILILAVFSVQAAYYHFRARNYFHATIFLHGTDLS
jgi:Domain of unknown function (DUF1836)